MTTEPRSRPATRPPPPTQVVLLRGVARERGHWGDFPERLHARTGLTPIAVDLPGAGSRHRERVPPTVPGLLLAVREELRRNAQTPGGPALVVGLSLGGMIALEWLLQATGELWGAVLINTSAGGLAPFWRRARPKAWPKLLAITLPQALSRREARILDLTSTKRAQTEARLADWVALARAQPVSSANAARQLWSAARYRPKLRPLAQPVLLLASQGDNLVDPQCSLRLARALSAPIELHPEAGHDLPLDAPDWVVERIASWLVSACDQPTSERPTTDSPLKL